MPSALEAIIGSPMALRSLIVLNDLDDPMSSIVSEGDFNTTSKIYAQGINFENVSLISPGLKTPNDCSIPDARSILVAKIPMSGSSCVEIFLISFGKMLSIPKDFKWFNYWLGRRHSLQNSICVPG